MNEKDIKEKYPGGKKIYVLDWATVCISISDKVSSKTYIVRIQQNGKSQIITLGKHLPLSLKDARVKAMHLIIKVDASNIIFSQLKEKYREEMISHQSKAPNQVIGYLENIERGFGCRKVIDITRAMFVC